MKKRIKLLGIITILVIIVFSMAACDSNTTSPSGSGAELGEAVYTGKHSTNDLALTITEQKTGKAAYDPKVNDSYTLAVGENLSSGTVTLIETTDVAIKFTLKASKDGTTFAVTVTLSNNRITNISGTVTFDGEGSWNGPGNVNNGTSGGGGGGAGGVGGSSSSGNGKTSTGNKVIAMDTATANSKLESLNKSGTLVFNNLQEKDMPVKGDIICSGPSEAAPYGFLYKVNTVTTSGSKTVVTTEDATLEEAVYQAEVSQSFDLVFAEGEVEEIDGVEVVRNTNSMQRAALPFDTTIKLNINKEVSAGVNLKGSLDLSAKVDCDIKIEWFTMERFEFSIKPQFKTDLAASISGKIEKEKPVPIYHKKSLPELIMVGPVPVVFSIEITIECVITAEGEVVLSAQKLASWDYAYKFGVRYTKGSNLSAFKENTSKPAEYLKGLQLDLNGEVKLEPRVGFMVGLYETAFVGMSGGFYARLAGKIGIPINANANATAKLSLFCGLWFGADAELKILTYKIGGLHVNFYKDEWPIWERTWTTTTAVSSVSLNKSSLSLAVGGTETLTATVNPSNATNKTVSWATSNSAVATVSGGTVTAKSAGTATITATTADGNKTATCAVTVSSPTINNVEYYWVNEHGSLVTTSGGAITINAGTTLTITAQSTGYVVKQWNLNGVDTGQSGSTYNFSSMQKGKHILGLFVEKNGKLYNTNITITVK